jgi:glycosyltransferase involved in cell wall biosynthesis
MVNGIKISPDAGSVARGINQLLDSPDTMSGLANGGRDKLIEFTWERSVEKLLGVYREAQGT